MDQAAVKQNEKTLGKLLDKGDKKFVALVGVMSLSLLTEQMDADAYQKFLHDCITNAHEIQKHKMLGTDKPDKDEEGAEPTGSLQ